MIGFKLDGVEYDINVISLKRSFQILDTNKSGRNTTTGKMIRDIIGTYYNYTMEIDPNLLDADTYNTFYEQISAPIESHTMVFPYADETLTFSAYITAGEDTLFVDNENNNHWSGLSITFTAMEPKRVPE